MNKKAFTFIEILIVVTIIGILAAITIPLFMSAAKKTNDPNTNPYYVQFLFETNGIKVYRFRDECRPVYFTDVRGRTEWTTTSGKSTVRHEVEMTE